MLIEDQGSASWSEPTGLPAAGGRAEAAPEAGDDVLDRLGALLDELGDLPARSLANLASMGTLAKAFSRLDGIYARAAGAFRDWGDWPDSGALSAGAWLATEARLPIGEARRRVWIGATLRELKATSAAWVSGEINSSHVSRLAGVYRRGTACAMERDEESLIDKAKTLKYESFSKVIAYWEGLADEDGADSSAQAKRDRRDAYLVRSINDMYLGRITLDPVSGTIVATELERQERILFETDWAQAKERLGRCQADHIQPYSEDGPTTQENGRLACGTHNRARRSKADPPLWRRPHSGPDDPDDA